MGNLFSINSPLWNLTNKLLHLLWLSILWVFCCIPIITIGAATTAVYTVTLKYVRNEEGYITSSFFHSFKQNFKQASIAQIILLLVGLILGVELIVYSRSNQTGMIPMILMTVFFSLFVTFVLVNIYIYPLLAKFNNTIFRTLLNALVMALRHWPSSISMLMISLAIITVGFLYFPPILLCAPALIAYINSYFLVKVFDNYICP